MIGEHFEAFFSNISGIYRGIQRLKSAFSKEMDVKSVQIFWLYLLRQHPDGLTSTELAEASQTTRALISREIAELAERNLIFFDSQTSKRRYGSRIFLTESGKARADRISQIAWNVQNAVSRDISPEDLTVFYRVLEKLSLNFSRMHASDSLTSGGNHP